MIPLLIVVPYWENDIQAARLMAKLICALQPNHAGDHVHVMVAPRQDCLPDEELERIFREKFTVFRHHCNSPQRGYPGAANGMFFSVYISLAQFSGNRYDTTIWMEPDMVPTQRGWTDRLIGVWKARKPNIYAMGHIFSADGSESSNHLNGGALWSPEILKIIPDITSCLGAWDWGSRRKILEIAQPIQEIHYFHHARNMIFYPRGGPVVVIHGCKDESLARLVASDNGVIL